MGRSSGTLPETLFQWPGRFFFGKIAKIAEIRRKSGFFRDYYGKSRVCTAFDGKKSEKVAFFREKCGASPGKLKKIDFLKNVPRASRDALCMEITQRASRDALCVGRSPRRSLRKTRYVQGTTRALPRRPLEFQTALINSDTYTAM